MKVIPLAAESLGVRSMATFVEVGRTGILIDPGATLAPSRFGLPPTAEEWDALRRANDRISAYATRAELVFVSHYHEDHFRSDPATYTGRTVLVKDPRRMVQGLQARRALELWKALDGPARVQAADGQQRREAEFALEMSAPLPHGLDGTSLGSVVALTIVDPAQRERFVFASDLQGPLSPVATAYLVRQRPTLVYVSGPPSYIERDLGAAAITRGVDNVLKLIETTGCRVLMDHHAMRDTRWETRFERLWETGRVVTAAGFLGLPAAPLECRRHELWGRARKPAAKAPTARAIMTRKPPLRATSTFARRGYTE
jgi:predicted metallo-beta-lactamase superfamily hydrolase